jgi:hypothetical protein
LLNFFHLNLEAVLLYRRMEVGKGERRCGVPAPRPSSNSRRRKDANGPNRGGEQASLTVRVQLHYPLSEEVCKDPVEDDAHMSDASTAAWRIMEETGGVIAGWVVGEVEEPWRVGSCSCGGGR